MSAVREKGPAGAGTDTGEPRVISGLVLRTGPGGLSVRVQGRVWW